MIDFSLKKNVLVDEDCCNVLKRILGDGKDLFFIDNVMVYVGFSFLVMFIKVEGYGIVYLKYIG